MTQDSPGSRLRIGALLHALSIRQILAFISLSVAIAAVLTSGPMVTELVSAILNGDSATIYTAAWGHELIIFPSLGEWFFGEFSAVAAAAGCIVALALLTLNANNPRAVFAITTITGGVALSLFDLLFLTYNDEFTFKAVFTVTTFNFIGSAALGAIISLALSVGALLANRMEVPERWRVPFIGMLSVLLCGVVTTGAYYVCDFFFRPLPVQIDLTLSTGARGSIVAHEPSTKGQGFKIIPPKTDPETVKWSSPDGNLQAKWTASLQKARFDMSVDLFSGCFDSAALLDRKPVSSFKLQDVREVSAGFKEGAKTLVLFGGGKTGTIDINRDSAVNFGIDRDEATKKNQVWEFVNLAKLQYDSRDDVVFLLDTYTLDLDNGEIVETRPVILQLMADGKVYDIKLEGPATSPDTLIACKQLSASRAFQKGAAKLPKAAVSVTARITLRAQPTTYIFQRDTSRLVVAGGDGWIELTDIDDETLERSEGGRAALVQTTGEVLLEVNGVAEPSPKASDAYLVVGDLIGRYEKQGHLRFTGVADRLYKNSMRRNPTKFEGGLAGQLTLLGGALLTALSSAVFLFTKAIAANKALGFSRRDEAQG